jgi:hypothetical protein
MLKIRNVGPSAFAMGCWILSFDGMGIANNTAKFPLYYQKQTVMSYFEARNFHLSRM